MNNKQQSAKKLASVLLMASLSIFMAASCGNPKKTPTEKNSGQDDTTGNNNTHSENSNTQQKDTLTTTLKSTGINPQQVNWINETLQEIGLSPALIAYMAESEGDEFRAIINPMKNKKEIKEFLNEINEDFEKIITGLNSVGISAQQVNWVLETSIEIGKFNLINELNQKLGTKLSEKVKKAKSKEDIKQIFNSFMTSPQNT